MTIRDGPYKVLLCFDADFELGMGLLGSVLNPIAERVLVQNIQQIMTGLHGPTTTFREQS